MGLIKIRFIAIFKSKFEGPLGYIPGSAIETAEITQLFIAVYASKLSAKPDICQGLDIVSLYA